MDCTLLLTEYPSGFLGSFLSKGLKTNQLEVNTDERTLRPIARLKEPRDLFALPKDKEHDCPQQAPRWPIECQVLEERIVHIRYAPTTPEPYNTPTGSEPKPRPVGEENGLVVFNYNPISAVNYDQAKRGKPRRGGVESSDSDISSDDESRGSSMERTNGKQGSRESFSKLLQTIDQRSSSNSNDEYAEEVTHERLRGGFDAAPLNKRQQQQESDQEQDQDQDQIQELEQQQQQENNQSIETKSSDRWLIDYNGLNQLTNLSPITPVRVDKSLLIRLNLCADSRRTSSSTSVSSTTSELLRHLKNQNDNKHRHRQRHKHKQNRHHDGDKTLRASQPQTRSNQLTESTTDSKTSTYNSNSNLDTLSNLSTSSTLTLRGEKRMRTNADVQNNSSETGNDDSSSHTDPLLPQFSRSAVGGAKFLTNCHPCNPDDYVGLQFESRFESGNLAKAVQITQTYYELYLRPDLYTSRSKQWFYFQVKRTRKDLIYRFSIVNLVKADSLYNEGMRPVMYSTINAKQIREGWRRCATNICYYRNDDEGSTEDEEDNGSYTLTFNIEFPHDNDTVYFAHNYPYTYSDLQDYLMDIQKHPVKSKFCKLRLLCRSLAGNNVYYLTVTAPTQDEESMKRKKAIVVSARVHPSETPASWMMKGLMDFITSDALVAKRLRHKFIFKLIPMLNPDGVIVGNTRNSLTGKDLNRQYRTVIRETYPSIWYTKAMIKRLIDECGVAMYCDMHAHSRKHNIFIYGCENKRNPEKKLTEQVFPLMVHKNVADKFSFEGCKFKIQRSKEGTGRIVVWMLGITNSYTLEASFGGSSLGSRKGTHFSIAERLRLKIIERLLKEGSSADEPLNIPLSDYSSDEGESSSSSDNEGKASLQLSDLEGPCCDPLKAPPCSPENNYEVRRFKFLRMRKVMNILDRIYFQPLFQHKTRNMMRRRQRQKKLKQRARMQAASDAQMRECSSNTETLREWTDDSNSCRNESKRCSHKLRRLAAGAQRSEKLESSGKMDGGSDTERDPSSEQNSKTSKKHHIKKKKKKTSYPANNIANQANKDANCAPKVPSGRLKVARTLRLWLAARQILIIRRKKPRKIKIRAKVIARKQQRQPLDMPTTDPGSDIIFSTDDEYDQDGTMAADDVFNGMPRPRRILLQSELQRRYIEEIGDGIQRRMPPELIITSPNETTTVRVDEEYHIQVPNTAPGKDNGCEFPPMATQNRRTYSWHSLQTSSKTTQKMKVSMASQSSAYNNKEELQFKLSLKKKIWTGVQPDNYTAIDSNRPLSWSMPPLNNQTKKVKATTRGRTPQKMDDKEAFLSACSEKLMAWQQSLSSNSVNVPKKKIAVNLMSPEETDQERAYRILKQVTPTPKKDRSFTSLAEPKYRKNKSSLSKLAETTHFIPRLPKPGPGPSTNINAQSRAVLNEYRQQQPKLATSLPSSNMHTQATNSQKLHIQKNKFKAGGIVATAVQPLTKCKGKKLRMLNTTATKYIREGLASKESPSNAVAMETSTFVGKMKAKIKKKKPKKFPSDRTQVESVIPAAPNIPH